MHHRPTPALGSISDIWALLLRRKLVVAAAFVLTTASVVAGSMLLPPSYTAQTSIMVKQGREFFYRAEVGDASNQPLLSLAEMVNSQVEILDSRDLAEQVIRELGLDVVYPDMLEEPGANPAALLPVAVARFQESLTVMDVLESSIIRVSYENRNPRVAADALNLLVEKFKEKHLAVFAEPSMGFLAQKLRDYQARLTESEDALEKFRQEHAVYELAEQRSLLLTRRMELDAEHQAAGFRVAELGQTLQLLSGPTLSADPAEPPPDPPPPITEDRASLVSRRGELASLLQEADMRLAELRQQLMVVRERQPAGDEPGAYPGAQQFRSLDEAFIRLLDLQLQEKELLRDYNESSRMITGVRERIALVEGFLRERGVFVREVIEATLRDELEGLVARRASALQQIEALDAQILAVDQRLALDELAPVEARASRIRLEQSRIEEQLQQLDELEKELRRLERQRDLAESSYQAFVGRSEDARLMEQLDQAKMVNIAVIERATPPNQPSSLSPKMRALIGACVGLFAGLAAAVFLDLVSRS